MPVQISDPEKSKCISVILGYRDIGIGRIDEPEYKGVGFVQLSRPYKKGEEIPESEQQGENAIKVCLLVRTKGGLAQLRQAVAAVEKSMGLNKQTMANKLTGSFLEEIGDKEAEIESLKYRLKLAEDITNTTLALRAAQREYMENRGDEARGKRVAEAAAKVDEALDAAGFGGAV